MKDHDQRLKLLLQALFAELIRLALPAWANRFDFDSVEWLPQEVFPDPPQGERRIVDLVARIKLRHALTGSGQDVWITLIHVEVEASGSVAPLRRRMFEYRNFLQGRHGLPVLPIALFLRVGLDGLGWDEYEEWYWEERLELFRFAYVGLPALDGPAHATGENLLGVALAGLMRIPEDRRAELKADAMQRAATSGQNDYTRYLMCECIEAYLPLVGPHLADYQQRLLTPKYQEAVMLGQTSRELGVLMGQRRMLERLLTKKFGPLPPAVVSMLSTLNEEQLIETSERLLNASTLDDLGLTAQAPTA